MLLSSNAERTSWQRWHAARSARDKLATQRSRATPLSDHAARGQLHVVEAARARAPRRRRPRLLPIRFAEHAAHALERAIERLRARVQVPAHVADAREPLGPAAQRGVLRSRAALSFHSYAALQPVLALTLDRIRSRSELARPAGPTPSSGDVDSGF
jgi:hypothetical protein